MTVKKKHKNLSNLKTFFIIINLFLSIISISTLVYAQNTTGSGNNPPSTPGLTPPNNNPPPAQPPSVQTTPGIVQVIPSPSTGQIIGGPGTGIINMNDGSLGTPPIIVNPAIVNPVIVTPGNNPPAQPPGTTTISKSFGNFFKEGFLQKLVTAVALGGMIGGTIGTMMGGKNGLIWGTVAGTAGILTYQILEPVIGGTKALFAGIGVGVLIFIMTYKKESQENAEFQCLPWKAPIGGGDCQKCNDLKECSEYTCKSYGQACEIVNPGTSEQKCVWKNPHDVNSPIITIKNVSKEHKYSPDKAVRPPATGIKVTRTDNDCLKAFTPLTFNFITDEPSECKIDYNLIKETENGTNTSNAFEMMDYFVGGNSLLLYEHSETLSLPGPDAINAIAPELKNNGEYSLYIRCRDANGNFNQDAFSVSFCVEKGPDTTPPRIEYVNIPSNNPVQFNKTSIAVEVYVNEPSECKWSRQDIDYKLMENKMTCEINLWEMNNKNVYTCRTNLTGIESRKENLYYFRCKDQPWTAESDRNVNRQSYLYKVIGTQPLNILSIEPNNKKITGATDFVQVSLEIKTDNGYKNGESLCYFSSIKPKSDEDYVLFLDTGKNEHRQRQDIPSGNYTYYFKCVDLGGNSAYNKSSFNVVSDLNPPTIIRAYRDTGELRIITDEESECSYSNNDCNFEIESGIQFTIVYPGIHSILWETKHNYFIRCKDSFNNQPNPNTCSIIVRPSYLDIKKEVIEL